MRTRACAMLLAAFALASLSTVLLGGCDADLQKFLDGLTGKPKADSSSDTVSQDPLPIPPGQHLYCITNIGHTLVLYDLAANAANPNLQRYLDLDPVGPWFFGAHGYYISRVDTSGAGANALIEFDPKTALETRRLSLGVNTNPNSMLVLPGFGGVAWIAVRGSTFNSPYGPNGIGVVNLNTMSGTIVSIPAGKNSLISFVWDAACPANSGGTGPCVYALVNGFDGVIHPGTLLVYKPDGSGNPVLLDTIALGGAGVVPNPLEDMLLDGTHLWIVNNGGYTPGNAAVLQVLDTTKFKDSILNNETLAEIPTSLTATGVFHFDASTAWVTTYPSDVVKTVDLTSPFTFHASPTPSVSPFTGSVLNVTTPSTELFAGAGGFGAASLSQLDPTDGHLVASHALQAGNGTVSCGQFDTP